MHRLVLAAALILITGCASSSPSSEPRSLRTIAERPGPQVALTLGASDFAPGDVRYSFLIVDKNGASVERPRARVWVARSLDQAPFQQRVAERERVGVSRHADSTTSRLYVVHLNIENPGKYWILAKPIGGRPIQGLGNLIVRRRTFSPAIGSDAFPSRTPTLRSAHGNASAISTRVPPDRALLRYSVAGSLAAHTPFVVVFATPKFCTSRTCGPVVDVVDAVRKEFSDSGIRFIHVEIYEQNDPANGPNIWVRQWNLPTEPWVFLVAADGKIAAKFEGAVSVAELRRAVRRYLT